MDYTLLSAILIGIAVLLFLILRLKIPAFISLLIASILTGLIAGLDAEQIIKTIQEGMGGTLGFVATVVGLGAIFGGILEHSGGANAIAAYLTKKMGTEKAPLAMLISGFVIAIPVFFDVAFIILIPVIYAIQRTTKKSLLLYAIPLLAGLAATHAFIPPTPGPIAVADIIGADIGWVIAIGFMAGIPTVLISGLVFGKYIAKKIHIDAPEAVSELKTSNLPSAKAIFAIIAVPILLILINSFVASDIISISNGTVKNIIKLIGHPFSALIIANIIAWYSLGILRGVKSKDLLQITTKSMAPAGTIILLTGAGGVFKQVLVNTGGGKMLAESLVDIGFPVLLFAFVTAALVRVIQGSATVAMITAAGLVAPLIINAGMDNASLACLVISIASGASIFSHVNDSGFWLVGQYLNLSEKDTFRSWSVMTTILALCGFTMAVILNSIL
ncbi:gluconate transporter [Leptobacterium flavescens]|uniref:Gluconate transporter n=1 Tax=Leptobacterium flavescens TaxID=472055 RepID=A0A6P0UK19_9FLAO|nr:gluconate:H+ symporter [Leptobacterium flavescens]NER13317.1 gluconate transporter [Leptobacterium flavescens]